LVRRLVLAHGVALPARILPGALIEHAFQQADGLKEIETLGLAE
jgi:hypothetical protein